MSILAVDAVESLQSGLYSNMPGIKSTRLDVGATNNNLTISNGSMTPNASPYAGYLLKQLTRLNLDRITFPKIYKPTNTKCQVDIIGSVVIENPLLSESAVFGTHFNNSTADFIGSKTANSNNGTFDSINYKFGGYSIRYTSASSQYTDWVDSADWATGTGDFYYDFWFRRASSGVSQNICGQGDTAAFSTLSHYCLFSTNTLRFGCAVGSSSYTIDSTGTITDSNWHHVRAGRDGSTIRLFIDGVQQGSGTAISGSVNDVAYPLAIGRIGSTNNTYFDGNIDEFVFVKGASPGSTNFTPPTLQYRAIVNVSSNTITLDSIYSSSDNYYINDMVVVSSGTGIGQTRHITNYNGTTKVATLNENWTTNPTASSEIKIYDGFSGIVNISPGYDFTQIDYSATPTINVLCSLEKQTGATASPSMGVPIVAEINLNPIQSGSGTGTLSSGQLTVNVTLSRAVSLYNAKPFCDVISTSASAYVMNVTAQMTTETNLQLKFSGSNASAPFSYVWHVIEY